MNDTSIHTAGDADIRQAIQTVTLGFSSDPVARWIWPETDVYLASMPRFIEYFAGSSFARGTALVTSSFQAAALWLPPDAGADDDAIDALLRASTRPEIDRDMTSFFAQMAEYHPREAQCWYLPMIATDPAHQGRGLGSSLLERALVRCDADGVAAYLEASNPRCVPLYERHGFEVIGEIQFGSSPPMYPMLRVAA